MRAARVWLAVVAALLTAFVVVVAVRSLAQRDQANGPGATQQTDPSGPTSPPRSPPPQSPSEEPTTPTSPPPWRPGSVFGDKFLVAYYGTPGTTSLGVLGDGSVDAMTAALKRAAQPFAAASGRPVQIVYEIIATVADSYPGPYGTYSHDIDRSTLEPYLKAAKRYHALVVLDLQPGRSDFLTVAKRWAWALKEPNVGIALDPEWRMHGDEIPGQVFGWVDASEIEQTAHWVANLTRQYRLPQKLFLIHQFVPETIVDIADVTPVRGLAMVQHVDGWGDRQDKLATYHNVARPHQFTMGFKLFYRQDVDMFTPAELLKALPGLRYVSYQ